MICCWSNVSGGDDVDVEDAEDGGEKVVDEDETDVLLAGCITLNSTGNFAGAIIVDVGCCCCCCWLPPPLMLLLLNPTAEVVNATRMGVLVGVRPVPGEALLPLIARLSFLVTSNTNAAIR